MSTPSSAAEMEFYRAERPILVSQGMTDYDDQCKELKRRWDLLQTFLTGSATAAAAAPRPVEVPFDAPLDKADQDSMSLVLSRVDTTNPLNIKYLYVQVEDVDAAPSGLSDPFSSAPGKRKAVGESSSVVKRSKPVEPAPTLGWLLSNVKKDTLQNICEDLGVAVSGNKDDLMMRITGAALKR